MKVVAILISALALAAAIWVSLTAPAQSVGF
jgi:hypothetical protein